MGVLWLDYLETGVLRIGPILDVVNSPEVRNKGRKCTSFLARSRERDWLRARGCLFMGYYAYKQHSLFGQEIIHDRS